MSKRLLASLIVWSVLFGWTRPAHAQSVRAYELPVAIQVGQPTRRLQRKKCGNWCRPTTGWNVSIPVWIPGVTGTLGAGNATFEPESDSSDDSFPGTFERAPDRVTSLEFAFVGAVEHYRGPWTFGIDAFGLTIGEEIKFTSLGAEVDAELSAAIVRATVSYQFAQHFLPIGGSCDSVIAQHEVYVGARIYFVGFEATLGNGRMVDVDRDWIDPIIGIRSRFHVRNCWSVLLSADIGGFGVGSEFAWSVLGGLTYQFSKLFSMTLAWEVLDMDYARTLAGENFVFDIQLSGPFLMMSFSF